MTPQFALFGILTVAGIGSAVLVAIASAAFFHRRSWSYFLVTVALGIFVVRTILAAITIGGIVPLETHHLIEHLLDALAVGLLFTAVYAAQTVTPDPPFDDQYLQDK